MAKNDARFGTARPRRADIQDDALGHGQSHGRLGYHVSHENTGGAVERPTVVLTCFRVRRRIGAYLDGALADADASSTERHLARCASCQHEAGQLRRVKTLVAEAAAVPEPDWTGFWPGIVRGIEAQRVPVRTARARPAWRLWPGWAIGGAAVAALAVAILSWQGGRGPLPAEAGVLVSAADTEHPTAAVMVYTPPDREMAVVWLFDSD